MDLFAQLVLIFAAAVLAPLLFRFFSLEKGWLLALAPLAVCISLLLEVPEVMDKGYVNLTHEWVPSLQIAIDLRLDGLSLLMGLLITGIGTLILLYANDYLKGHPKLLHFYSYILLFMGSMLGLVFSNHLIVLFIFWELTSISSYLLIGFNHQDADSRKKALQALLVTGFGGVAMLAGFILLGKSANTYLISDLEQMGAHALYLPIIILVLLGAFTKSAQFPFHFWLPNAMAAPTPVSAYLHSATMVKAGVYLMARLTPSLGNTDYWNNTLILFGSVTMLVGAFKGLFQTDLKKILAYTTLSVLGVLTMLLGIGTELALQAAVIFLLGHALYKAALFMVAGSIDHECGTREVTILGNLRKLMPITALAAGLAALSKAGVPLFFGFIGKEYLYKATLDYDAFTLFSIAIILAAFITNALLLALAFKAGIHPFWHKTNQTTPKKAHEAPAFMWLGPLSLGLLGLGIGILPGYLERPLIEPAVSSIYGQALDLKVALWHGFNLPLLLSALTIACGITVYTFRQKIWQKVSESKDKSKDRAEGIYEAIVASILKLASWQTNVLQSGYLRNYFLIIIGSSGVLLFIKLVYLGGLPSQLSFSDVHAMEWGLAIVMIFATLLAATTNSRLTSLLSLGIVGFGIALVFMLYGAADLAVTQILVETLTVVLFMLVVYKLPRFKYYSSKRERLCDALFSISIGGLFTALVLKAQNIQIAPPISDRLAEWSYSLAKGKNVVNVILVDFRALDTLGEITVIAIAALGVVALLGTIFKQKKENP